MNNQLKIKKQQKSGKSIPVVDISKYNSSFSLANKLGRLLWRIVYLLLFRPFNLNCFRGWRSFVLRLFGARIGKGANIYASVKIWAPWNLEIGTNSSMGPKVDCYNQGKIRIGNNSIISQKSYLCASSHDFRIHNFPLILKPIEIENQVWIAADAFIGPGARIGEGSVVGARSAVFGKVQEWVIVGGNPAKIVGKRELKG